MRIGILGGTFNPIHKGHLKLAEGARRRLKLDKVIFVPANIPPHKKSSCILSAKERFRMVQLAIKAKLYFDISDYEIREGGTSYSVKTLGAFRRKFGKAAEIFFLTGSDSLSQLNTWKDIDRIAELANLVIVSRPGYKLDKALGLETVIIPTPDISSSIIRQRIKKGMDVKKFLPIQVYSYIEEKGFYK